MNIESGSSLGTFMACPRLYYYKYVQLLESRGYSQALGVGIFFHAEIERFSGGRPNALEEEYARVISKIDPTLHAEVAQDMTFAKEFAELWRQHWSTEHPFGNDKFEWLNTEKEWHFNLDEHGHVHAGKSDGVVRHKEWGTIFLYELKTAADRARDSYMGRLELDSQISSNIMALRHEGIDVQGVLYDVAWKPALRLLTGRKTKPDETKEEFNNRMLDAIKANRPEFFQRQIIYRNDNAIRWHEEDLKAQFAALDLARETGAFYRNTRNCETYGKRCAFFSVCIENSEELESLYEKKDRKLSELSKEIQDANS